MRWVLVSLLFLQAGFFADPAVTGTETGATRMEVDLSVSAPPGGSVVAHFLHPGGPQQTHALREREPGRYGGIVEVARIDFVVVFEALDGTGTQSEPWRLTDIGLDRTLLGMLPVSPTTTVPGPSTATRGWGWLALAMGAASLALLALWALPDRNRAEPDRAEPAADTSGGDGLGLGLADAAGVEGGDGGDEQGDEDDRGQPEGRP